MMHTIEDTLEILAGVSPRNVHIKIDHNEKTLIQSLGRQVSKGVALTDRQLDLALKKITKYQDGLTRNGVDTATLISNVPLRMPLREVDRTQKIYFEDSPVDDTQKLVVRYTFSKKLEAAWSRVREKLATLNISVNEEKSRKIITATEMSVYYTVKEFLPLNFDVDYEVDEIFKKIEEILAKKFDYVPYLDYTDEKFVVKNVNKYCEQALATEFPTVDEKNVVKFLSRLKNYEIFEKSDRAVAAIYRLHIDPAAKKVLDASSNRYLVNSSKNTVEELVNFVEKTGHWPAVVILDENPNTFTQVKTFVDAVAPFVPKDKINVFFRMSNGQKNCDEFNQYVKDNALNNYIDESTRLVFITKDRIPKPLIKSAWKPETAIVAASHAFGKINAYLNGFQNVYYYNDSIVGSSQRNRSIPIVEL